MNLNLPPDLEAKLNRLATSTGRVPEQVAIELLTESVEYDEWYRGEGEKARSTAQGRQLREHAEVVSLVRERFPD